MREIFWILLGGCLSACASGPNEAARSLEQARSAMPQSSPECLAQKLKPSDPFPASAIPESAMKKSQSGWVALRYDVIAGSAQNIVIVASEPAGVYDSAALQHASRYKDPSGATVRGCIMTIEVKF